MMRRNTNRRLTILPVLLLLSTLFSHFILTSCWVAVVPSPQPRFHYQSIIMSSASTPFSEGDDDGDGVSGSQCQQSGSLLVSNMDRIGLSTDASSNLRLLLASQSPRRREILDMMGLAGRYTAEPSPLDEEKLQIELAEKKYSPHDYARTLAERKAHASAVDMDMPSDDEKVTLIIGSDTIVDLDGNIMEKPKDESDAFGMITRLSGNWHQVHTGVAVYAVGGGRKVADETKLLFSFTDTANVKFASLTEHDVRSYIASKEPMDKAGSYGIQGIGGQLVEKLEGDFFTVMGLPMHRFSRELSNAIRLLDI